VPENDFDFIAFKVAYSNDPDTSKVMEDFWKKIDTNAFSFWWM